MNLKHCFYKFFISIRVTLTVMCMMICYQSNIRSLEDTSDTKVYISTTQRHHDTRFLSHIISTSNILICAFSGVSLGLGGVAAAKAINNGLYTGVILPILVTVTTVGTVAFISADVGIKFLGSQRPLIENISVQTAVYIVLGLLSVILLCLLVYHLYNFLLLKSGSSLLNKS